MRFLPLLLVLPAALAAHQLLPREECTANAVKCPGSETCCPVGLDCYQTGIGQGCCPKGEHCDSLGGHEIGDDVGGVKSDVNTFSSSVGSEVNTFTSSVESVVASATSVASSATSSAGSAAQPAATGEARRIAAGAVLAACMAGTVAGIVM